MAKDVQKQNTDLFSVNVKETPKFILTIIQIATYSPCL